MREGWGGHIMPIKDDIDSGTLFIEGWGGMREGHGGIDGGSAF